VFQDVPFSCPDTYRYLDSAYPGSKFILTVRKSPEIWYESLVRFHAEKFGQLGQIPSKGDLLQATYLRKGFMYNTVRLHGTSDYDPYNKEIMIAHYEAHNEAVRGYFRDRPEDLLELDVSRPDAYRRFVEFIGVESSRVEFPWENRGALLGED
jgi:hypothetical protein